MNHASLFTGIGGFDKAAEEMGWNNIFQCEIDEFCMTVLKYHFPNTILYGDIKQTDFRQYRGKIDVLTAGFPCQPFSTAGQRKGADDDRFYWPETFRAVQEIRPPWFVGENVAGITSILQPGSEIEVESQGSLFQEDYTETILEQEYVIESICKDLESEGYSVQPIIIPACAVGAPHRRDRVWFLATLTDTTDSGVESMQQEGKDGVRGFKTSSDTYGYDAIRCGYGETGRSQGKSESIQEERERVWYKSERIGDERITSDTESIGRKQSGNTRKGRNGFKNRNIITPNTFSERQSGEEYRKKKSGFFAKESLSDYWKNFPTQPPVRCGNDGITAGVLGTTFPKWGKRGTRRTQTKWRQETIKACGNGIVYQVALEIFKAIEIVEEQI